MPMLLEKPIDDDFTDVSHLSEAYLESLRQELASRAAANDFTELKRSDLASRALERYGNHAI